MGDMNAELEVANTGRELMMMMMGGEALGEMMNENGEVFADFCTFNQLVIGVRQCVQTQRYSQSEMKLLSPFTRRTHYTENRIDLQVAKHYAGERSEKECTQRQKTLHRYTHN
ncbi:unnamed protein product [Heterobilharzia americana]|nr:unnamed protein product [Heterobilharzia americana]